MRALNKKYLLILIVVVSLLLRLWKINIVPVSLFSDEIDVGYQAYSFLKTGRDYFGNSFPLYFQSFADARAPLYIYSAVPTVAVWGITPLGVRLPAVIFGVLGIWAIFLLAREIFSNENIALMAATIMAVSPWHIQYSRAAFEVTMLLFFLLIGVYLILKAREKHKYLWLGVLCFVITPWIYSTAKLFAPMLLMMMFFIYRKSFLRFPKKYLYYSLIPIIIFGLLLAHSFFVGEGAQRFSYISIFSDPTTKPEVEYSILSDAIGRKYTGGGLLSAAYSRVLHNEISFWTEGVVGNIFRFFSTDFLFINGDPNLRHSIDGVGQLYRIEVVALILGVITLFALGKQRDVKIFLLSWLFFGIIPSAITRDGGDHATRLIITLPVLILIISYGLIRGFPFVFRKWTRQTWFVYGLFFIFCFLRYQHYYWLHNPFYSERWWHSAYKEVITTVEKYEDNFDKIIISNANDDTKIFFAGYTHYDPVKWQEGYKEEYIEGFGDIKHYEKYYFGQVQAEIGINSLGETIDRNVLYIASEREVGANLVMKSEKIPEGLKLESTIFYPSGEPAFYAFSKK